MFVYILLIVLIAGVASYFQLQMTCTHIGWDEDFITTYFVNRKNKLKNKKLDCDCIRIIKK